MVPIFLVMVWILFFCHGNNAPSDPDPNKLSPKSIPEGSFGCVSGTAGIPSFAPEQAICIVGFAYSGLSVLSYGWSLSGSEVAARL